MAEAIAVRQGENLALVFQEILTATVRIRADRQAVSDAESFRGHIREAVRRADEQGRSAGYAPEDIRVGLFAAIAFLDESILNSKNPLFADWPRKPLQEELFGGHVAGEIFFKNIDRLLSSSDTSALADILEVYLLCLLLGYGGRYASSGRGELHSFENQITERIRRIRGTLGPLSPDSEFQATEKIATHSDSLARILMWTAIATLAILVVLFAVFKLQLNGGAAQLATLAGGAR